MKKIYISGKITDNPNYKADFEAAELALKIAGCQPVNPAEEHLPDGATWADYMRQDIKLLCDCDAIYMLNGWRESAGAKIEHKLARDLGMEIIYEIKKQKEYDDQYREEINRKARARYRAKCGLKAIKEAKK